MNKAALYRRSNAMTRSSSKQLMLEFASAFKWRSDGRDTLVDVGCGPGDVTSDIILPTLPSNFERLVGVDVSRKMIAYARKTQVHSKLSFELFNLEVEFEEQSLCKLEPFDHLTSFYCAMWVRNQRTCVRNFFKLLKPGGDMLVAFLKDHVVYDAYRKQSQDIRWAKYTHDYEDFVSPYNKSINPQEEYGNLLRDCGFTEYNVRMETKTFTFDADKVCDFFHAVNPFIDRIPADEKQAYLADIIDYFIQNEYVSTDPGSQTSQFNLPYTLMIVFARK